jgi:hypothetical protein
MLNTWWDAMQPELQVFYAIALTTSLLLVLQFVMLILGLDSDGDVDVDLDMDMDLDAGGDIGHGDAGVHLLSVRSLTAFFTGFGWAGVGALNSGWSVGAAILLALLAGSAFMAMVLGLLRTLIGLQESGTVDYRNAIGQVGTVYLPVPGAMERPGQVEVLVQGRLAVVPAFTRSPRRLERQERVRVTEILDANTLVVEPLDAAPPATER